MRRCVPPDDLVGITEIAQRAGVRYQTVQNWLQRHESFPAPVARLAMGPVWDLRDVESWLAIPRPVGRPTSRADDR